MRIASDSSTSKELKNVLGNSLVELEATAYLLKKRRFLSKCSATNSNTNGIFLQPPWLSEAEQ